MTGHRQASAVRVRRLEAGCPQFDGIATPFCRWRRRVAYAFGSVLLIRDEHPEYGSIRRPPVPCCCHGGASVYSGVDTQLLASVDISGRIFRVVSCDHPLPYEKRPEALTAADERGPDCREGTGSNNDNVFRIAGIYRSDYFPRTRSS